MLRWVTCCSPSVVLLCLLIVSVHVDGLLLPCTVDDCQGHMVELANGFSCTTVDECDVLLTTALDGIVPSDREQVC